MIEQLKQKVTEAKERRTAIYTSYLSAQSNYVALIAELLTAEAEALGFTPGVRVIYGKKKGVFLGYIIQGNRVKLNCVCIRADGSTGVASLGAYAIDNLKLEAT